MKFTVASTVLLATLAAASPAPAPAAQPDAAPAAEPAKIETRAQLEDALSARVAAAQNAPEIEAREAGINLAPREPKKSKPKGSSGGNTSAAITITPSRALEIGALSLGVLEVVRLWT